MSLLHSLVACPPSLDVSLPEYRQIELYTKKKTLCFEPQPTTSDLPLSLIAALCQDFMTFDAYLACSLLTVAEIETPPAHPLSTWERYLSLARGTLLEKVLAEVYRILRIVQSVSYHPHGHLEVVDGVVKINGAVRKVALSLEISEVGLRLLHSMVVYYCASLSQPYPLAYVEAMMAQYFFDLVAEIKRFSDEDRILYQFRHSLPFHRHFRFDCDNPKVSTEQDGSLLFEIGARHRNPDIYPIDFYFLVDGMLHIVPVEALKGGKLLAAEVGQWKARVPDGQTLPASFRSRFGREVMIVGIPMT